MNFRQIQLPEEFSLSRVNPAGPHINALTDHDDEHFYNDHPKLDWIIVGGESGPQARPFNIQWARDVIGQCKAAGVPVFVKQVGARPVDSAYRVGVFAEHDKRSIAAAKQLGMDHVGFNLLILKDRKGGDPAELPEDLRVREYPNIKEVAFETDSM